MASRSRLLAKLLDSGGDVKSDALDNVEVSDAVDEVVQVTATANTNDLFLVDSVSITEIKAVTFQVTAFSNTDYQFTTISAVMNNLNTDCEYNEFGIMESNEIATYEVRVNGGSLELLADSTSGVKFNVSRISVDI